MWLPPPCSASSANAGGVNKDSKVEGTESEGLGEGGDRTEGVGLLFGCSLVLVSSVCRADSGAEGDCYCRRGE